MKMLRCLVQAIAPVACGALALSLLAGDAMAGKKPPEYLLWPSGAHLVANYYPSPGGLGPSIGLEWPTASDADHYRLMVIEKDGHVSRVLSNVSPLYSVSARVGGVVPGRTYSITVTAYSVPDETLAYSESLQAHVNAR